MTVNVIEVYYFATGEDLDRMSFCSSGFCAERIFMCEFRFACWQKLGSTLQQIGSCIVCHCIISFTMHFSLSICVLMMSKVVRLGIHFVHVLLQNVKCFTSVKCFKLSFQIYSNIININSHCAKSKQHQQQAALTQVH